MDYVITLHYPKSMLQRQKSNFLDQIKRKFDVVKLKRLQYLLDREEFVDEFKVLAEKFGVNYKITEYPELPTSIKVRLTQKEEKVPHESKNFLVLKKGFEALYEMYVRLVIDPSRRNFDKEIDNLDEIVIDLALKVAEAGK